METKRKKIVFLGIRGHRHLIVELDQNYTGRDLEVLLRAFRRSLVSAEPPSKRRRSYPNPPGADIGRIVGPGYVIEMLGHKPENDR